MGGQRVAARRRVRRLCGEIEGGGCGGGDGIYADAGGGGMAVGRTRRAAAD